MSFIDLISHLKGLTTSLFDAQKKRLIVSCIDAIERSSGRFSRELLADLFAIANYHARENLSETLKCIQSAFPFLGESSHLRFIFQHLSKNVPQKMQLQNLAQITEFCGAYLLSSRLKNDEYGENCLQVAVAFFDLPKLNSEQKAQIENFAEKVVLKLIFSEGEIGKEAIKFLKKQLGAEEQLTKFSTVDPLNPVIVLNIILNLVNSPQCENLDQRKVLLQVLHDLLDLQVPQACFDLNIKYFGQRKELSQKHLEFAVKQFKSSFPKSAIDNSAQLLTPEVITNEKSKQEIQYFIWSEWQPQVNYVLLLALSNIVLLSGTSLSRLLDISNDFADEKRLFHLCVAKNMVENKSPLEQQLSILLQKLKLVIEVQQLHLCSQTPTNLLKDSNDEVGYVAQSLFIILTKQVINKQIVVTQYDTSKQFSEIFKIMFSPSLLDSKYLKTSNFYEIQLNKLQLQFYDSLLSLLCSCIQVWENIKVDCHDWYVMLTSLIISFSSTFQYPTELSQQSQFLLTFVIRIIKYITTYRGFDVFEILVYQQITYLFSIFCFYNQQLDAVTNLQFFISWLQQPESSQTIPENVISFIHSARILLPFAKIDEGRISSYLYFQQMINLQLMPNTVGWQQTFVSLCIEQFFNKINNQEYFDQVLSAFISTSFSKYLSYLYVNNQKLLMIIITTMLHIQQCGLSLSQADADQITGQNVETPQTVMYIQSNTNDTLAKSLDLNEEVVSVEDTSFGSLVIQKHKYFLVYDCYKNLSELVQKPNFYDFGIQLLLQVTSQQVRLRDAASSLYFAKQLFDSHADLIDQNFGIVMQLNNQVLIEQVVEIIMAVLKSEQNQDQVKQILQFAIDLVATKYDVGLHLLSNMLSCVVDGIDVKQVFEDYFVLEFFNLMRLKLKARLLCARQQIQTKITLVSSNICIYLAKLDYLSFDIVGLVLPLCSKTGDVEVQHCVIKIMLTMLSNQHVLTSKLTDNARLNQLLELLIEALSQPSQAIQYAEIAEYCNVLNAFNLAKISTEFEASLLQLFIRAFKSFVATSEPKSQAAAALLFQHATSLVARSGSAALQNEAFVQLARLAGESGNFSYQLASFRRLVLVSSEISLQFDAIEGLFKLLIGASDAYIAFLFRVVSGWLKGEQNLVQVTNLLAGHANALLQTDDFAVQFLFGLEVVELIKSKKAFQESEPLIAAIIQLVTAAVSRVTPSVRRSDRAAVQSRLSLEGFSNIGSIFASDLVSLPTAEKITQYRFDDCVSQVEQQREQQYDISMIELGRAAVQALMTALLPLLRTSEPTRAEFTKLLKYLCTNYCEVVKQNQLLPPDYEQNFAFVISFVLELGDRAIIVGAYSEISRVFSGTRLNLLRVRFLEVVGNLLKF